MYTLIIENLCTHFIYSMVNVIGLFTLQNEITKIFYYKHL